MSAQYGFIELDAVQDPVVRSGISYWQARKGRRAYPSRQQIVPREITSLLRHVVLVQVINDGEEYEFRIFGDAHTQVGSVNMQGSQMRDLRRVWPALAESLEKVYGQVVRTRQPVAVRALRTDCPGGNPVVSENVLLPLGKDDTRVDHILVFSVYAAPDLLEERIAC